MANVFVTGSSDGIGLQTAIMLVEAGHRVVLHARDEARATGLASAVPHAAATVLGDLASIEQTRALAKAAAQLGPFDAVIHNAGVGGGMVTRDVTADGFSRMFQVNVLAPYLLTALIPLPARLVYLSSGLEAQGIADLDDPQYERKAWNGMQAYSDAKLYDVMLAFAMARRYPSISNAVDPGWIRTKLGGPNAPGALADGADTPVWLATSDEPAATATGRLLKNRTVLPANPAASATALQDRLLEILQDCTGTALPEA